MTSMAQTEQEIERMRAEKSKNGRLLNEAIIKYRIEKKDIVDSAYRSKFSQYSGAGASMMSAPQGGDSMGIREDEELELDEEGSPNIRRGDVDQ